MIDSLEHFDLAPEEHRAVALVLLMLKQRNSSGGDGLFTGMARYEVLQGRLRQSAEISRTVDEFWDRLHAAMGWKIGPLRHDQESLALIHEGRDDRAVLEVFARRNLSTLMLARLIYRRARSARDAAEDAPAADAGPGLDLDDALDDIFDRAAPARSSAVRPSRPSSQTRSSTSTLSE